MFKYTTIAFLLFAAVSCKKETVTPTPPAPVPPKPKVAVFTLLDGAGNCNPIQVEGVYKTGVPMNAANKIILKINVTMAGSYSISVPGTNGYGFFVKDSLTTTGEQLITLPAIGGAPVYGTINTFNISTQGNTCTFAISVEGGELPGVLDDNDHMYFGNPGNAAINLDSVNNFLMRKPYYALSYSRDRGIPNWVCWHLYPADLGGISRQEDFREDNTLPASWYRVTPASYSGSGFDKGHNTPSGDRTSTVDANSSTFLMTNIIPQASTNNQIVWSRLEDSLRRLVTLGYEVYTIMGHYGIGGTGSSGFATTIDAGRVTVPASIWKVAVVLPNGNSDSSRVNSGTRVIAVDVPNTNSLGLNWKTYRVSVDNIEAATGYDLLTRLPATLQADLEARVDNL